MLLAEHCGRHTLGRATRHGKLNGKAEYKWQDGNPRHVSLNTDPANAEVIAMYVPLLSKCSCTRCVSAS